MKPMPCQIKICGLSSHENVKAAIDAGAHLVGFVHFAKSPRHVSLAKAAELKALLPEGVASVVVVVNPDDALLHDIYSLVRPDYIQLHGSESPERVEAIKKKYPKQQLIKALPVATIDDLSAAIVYEPYVDTLLFDAKPPKDADLPGGNGIAFDWNVMRGFESKKPWILSGGLTPGNVADAIMKSGAHAVDVSSGVESAPGVKDVNRIRAFSRCVAGI